MAFKNRDLLSIRDFSKAEILHIMDVASEMDRSLKAKDRKYSRALEGSVLASLFFEPSTRTRLSFEAAMNYLGGRVIGFSEPSHTSIVKGESFEDTIRVVDGYCDIFVMRHPQNFSAMRAAELAVKPVVNGGDGTNEHPTQTLFDLYTIMKNFRSMENLKVGFLGDLKYGRTVHSLSFALALFHPVFYFISPKSLALPAQYMDGLVKAGVECHEEEDLMKVGDRLDILYVTRIQKERFINPKDYQAVKGVYQIDRSFLSHAKDSLRIMHPLPRVDEINPQLDRAPQSIYFQQAHNALPVRMAVLALILGAVE
ncbi:aspartate carbamoyltransferase [Candidatus Woesearchaeota archaeon]|nr:aspartate carbamoyltransferase [Candidatus Woesearchaeota archaeon]